MKKEFLEFFNHYDKKIITIEMLEQLCPGECDYEDFSRVVRTLLADGILAEYVPKQRSRRDPELCAKYKLNRYTLCKLDRERIQEICLKEKFPESMDVSYYFQTGIAEWEEDFLYLQKIAAYLRQFGLPLNEATDQERSYEIFGDEKILLGQRRKILQKLRLNEAMKIVGQPEPLMMAVQPKRLQSAPFYHLIVENKAAYHALLPLMAEVPLASLVFGSGWKIVGNIAALPEQLGLAAQVHHYEYFGDFDEEGIAIWHSLQKKQCVRPALPFYQALIEKPYTIGKFNQTENKAAKEAFFSHFSCDEAANMRLLLDKRAYYPQECLTKQDLITCLRRMRTWK